MCVCVYMCGQPSKGFLTTRCAALFVVVVVHAYARLQNAMAVDTGYRTIGANIGTYRSAAYW